MDRALGRLLAFIAMAALLAVLIVVGAFFLECASWGQCPTDGKPPTNLEH